jgi:hypothetical protein
MVVSRMNSVSSPLTSRLAAVPPLTTLRGTHCGSCSRRRGTEGGGQGQPQAGGVGGQASVGCMCAVCCLAAQRPGMPATHNAVQYGAVHCGTLRYTHLLGADEDHKLLVLGVHGRRGRRLQALAHIHTHAA